MSQATLRKVASKFVKPEYTEVRPGDRVRVYTTVKEGDKERSQYFEGLVIRRRGGVGPGATFTVRRIGTPGVERIFSLHSPRITEIKVQRAAKLRRAKLHYLRGRSGKAARMKEIPVKQADRQVKHPWVDAPDRKPPAPAPKAGPKQTATVESKPQESANKKSDAGSSQPAKKEEKK